MRIGIVGGGQLGRMLALAAHRLGVRCLVLDGREDCCAGDVATHVLGEFDDVAALNHLANNSDVLTFEFENVQIDALRSLTNAAIYPSLDALAAAQDRLVEKSLFQSLGINTPRFAAVDSIESLRGAVETIGLPAVLKTRRMGYDGKGQFTIRTSADVDRAWASLGEATLILEAFVPFDRELSIIAARSREGEIRCYPLTHTRHADGILVESTTPPRSVTQDVEAKARHAISVIAEELDYVGVLALELFDCGGTLLANEFAPRVHNSGHWTIDGAACSQFENHVRAICGWPLGSTMCRQPTAMLNLIGRLPPTDELAAYADLHVHLYRKAESPGRKIGHLTYSAETHDALEAAIQPIRECVERHQRH